MLRHALQQYCGVFFDPGFITEFQETKTNNKAIPSYYEYTR